MSHDSAAGPAEHFVLESLDLRRNADIRTMRLEDSELRASFLVELLLSDWYREKSARLDITGARISGKLDLRSQTIMSELAFTECLFEEAPNFTNVELPSLHFSGSHLPGLDAAEMVIRGGLSLNNGFISNGVVDISGSRVGGAVRLTNGTIYCPDAEALKASRIRVESSMLCAGLQVVGQLRLISARIAGLLSLRNCHLTRPAGICLQCERIEVGESVFVDRGSMLDGSASFENATIKGGMDLRGSQLMGADGYAFRGRRMSVGRGISMGSGFHAQGEVCLFGATIGANLFMTDCVIDSPGRLALDCEGARAHTLKLLPTRSFDGAVDLRNARVEVLVDDRDVWPTQVLLDGFRYGSLQPRHPISPAERLEWLSLDPGGYSPQPYEQLIEQYRQHGHEDAVRKIGLTKQRHRRSTLSPAGRVWGYALDATVAYGYRSWQAGAWLTAFVALGSAFFNIYPPTAAEGSPQQPFNAAVYSLDLVLPIINLGLESEWIPGDIARWGAWTLILFGWLLTTAFVAGVTKLLSRG